MMKTQILQFADFTTTQKPEYVENKTFFLQIKKIINYTLRATLWQKYFCSVGNLQTNQRANHQTLNEKNRY